MSLLTRPIRLTATAVLGLLSIAGCNLNISNQAEARNEWKKSYTLSAGGTLEIRNTNGLIEIEPSDGTTVDIVAERIVRASTDEAAKDALAQLEIHEEVSTGKVSLDSGTHLGGVGVLFGGSRQVKYHVKAPRGTNVYLVTTNGEIQATGITGTFQAEATNGHISATGLTGEARAETTNGAIDLDVARIAEGGVTCSTTNGGITVTLPKDAKARISARVTNGGIDTENLTLGDVDQARRRLDATINGGGAAIHLETTNGGITIKGK
jgi:hypothetical protein